MAPLSTILLLISTVPIASPVGARRPITLVYDFEGQQAEEGVLRAVQAELAETWNASQFQFEWRYYQSLSAGEMFSDLVVMHFVGDRRAPLPKPVNDDEPASKALANTTVVDGRIQPFSKVFCDKVQRMIFPAESLIFGRALGRVLSHEMYRFLNQTKHHSKTGLAQRALWSAQLIAPEFRSSSFH